ncbi:MAG: DUF3499 family protein [Egibacteraceae bacterium]
MVAQLRTCTKTGCRWPAAASLSYRYATRRVWLLDLSEAPDPSLYDLCPHHADALKVPRGWERVDDRIVKPAMVELSAKDRASAAVDRRTAAGDAPVLQRELVTAGASRYAKLVAELPRLAAEVAASSATAGSHRTEQRPPTPDSQLPPSDFRPAPPPIPSRELAPLPAGALGPNFTEDAPPGDEVLEGQLAIPVDELTGDDAVVVSIELAGSRRRDRTKA